MIRLRTYLLGILLASWLASCCFAIPYSEIIFFGDSLSDVGNVSQRTDNFPFVPRVPADQTDAYFQGRFSNGLVWTDYFADLLGVGPISHSFAGGKNYAHGNAMTTGTGLLQGLVIDDVDDQVADYLGSGPTIQSDSLFVVFVGANDLLGGETNVNAPVNSLIDDVNALIAAGAENLLVANLPLLGLTPRYNSNPTQAASFNALTTSYNAALWAALDTVAATAPAVDVFRLDVEQLINDAVTNPGAFGLANVTDSAAPGLIFSTTNYDSSLIVSQPETYLFWDDIHPTTAAHELLAEYAFDAVTLSADFDFDGKVDSLDRVAWEASYGVDGQADANGDGLSNADDFLIWQRQNGSGVAAVSVTVQAVPEPGTLPLFLLCSILAGLHRSRRKQSSVEFRVGLE